LSPFIKSLRLCSLMFALLVAPAASVRAAQSSAAKSRITTASGVRVRAEPRADAAEVARLPLGVVVRELERSARRETVGGAADFWFRVAAPEGVEGWVFGGLTAAFDPARRAEVYRRIAAARTANAAATFPELSDLVSFLERAVTEVKEREVLAELELARLVALQRALANIDMSDLQKPPYAAWTKAREEQIVYSEPAGQWFVRADLFWDLQAKYKDLPSAELIAWEGAQMPLPGECEGYLPCHLYSLTQSEGRYLKLYPRGAHAGDALQHISEFLAQVVEDENVENPVFQVPQEDRAELAKTVAELRAQVTPASHALRERILEQLDTVARRYR
jgi:Bacterial SH3 domain